MKTKAEMKQYAQELIGRMTLEEKAGMLHGAGLFRTAGVPRLGIPPLKMSDGPMGVRAEFENGEWKQIGLPDDYVSYLPSGSAIAATWNPAVAQEMGQVLGEEARGRGKDVILAPSINLKRSPLCGRNFEYMSEDPCLTAALAVPLIKGVQQSDVAACVKHFALNNQETNRLEVNSKVDECVLHELYLPAFRACSKVSHTLMSAYNRVWGEYCAHNKRLLRNILREKWGYDGVIISDWSGVHATVPAAESALDIEMSVTNNFNEYFLADPLIAAVQDGRVKEELLNEKVEHILVLMQKLHMLGEEKRKAGSYDTIAHHTAALEAARESVVLLKNESAILPLPKTGGSLLVIGDNATRAHAPGGGSAEIKALYEITPLLGIRTVLGGETEVHWAAGYDAGVGWQQNENWQADSLRDKAENVDEQKKASARQKELRDQAVCLAAQYDRVVLVCGLSHRQDTEGADRRDIQLPYEQNELIAEVLKVKPDAVVVLVGGSPVSMQPWISEAKAVVWSFYAGMEGGRALAEVLFGDVNPSGKLPETFAKRLEDYPAHSVGEFPGGDEVDYTEGFFVGYRHFDARRIEPEFCFGHGLSYTAFHYTNLSVKLAETEQELQAIVSCQVQNIGSCKGSETVQFYAAASQEDNARPPKALCGFCKLTLAPGETGCAQVTLSARSLAHYDLAAQAFVTQPGSYPLLVGSSSRDIRLTGSLALRYRHLTAE